jgi:IS5 family transposase
MHQAKKGDQWHFGMEAHIGVDADAQLAHAVLSKRSFLRPGGDSITLSLAKHTDSLSRQ